MDADSVSRAIERFARDHRTALDFLNARQTQLLEMGAMVGVVQHYRASGYSTSIRNPAGTQVFRVKLGTRGHPADYSHVVCERGTTICELHSNLSVYGRRDTGVYCVDVAIVNAGVVPNKKGKKAAPPTQNRDLISFVETKKLVIYPMLLAQFVGIVHEVTPKFLRRNEKYELADGHLHPSLVALGRLGTNTQDILKSFKRRKYKISVAEHFDIRLSAAAKESNLSPFTGTISELLRISAAARPLPDDTGLPIDNDIDEPSGIVTTAAIAAALNGRMSDDEIPF